jgi:hypothetical protein
MESGAFRIWAIIRLFSPFYGIMEFFENRELDYDNEIH